MGTSKLKIRDLKPLDFASDVAKSLALKAIRHKDFKFLSKTEKLEILEHVLSNPNEYLEHHIFSKLAEHLTDVEEDELDYKVFELNKESKPYRVYGQKFIDQNTMKQMDQVMKLPVAEHGALMPDAHVGYGLPIGGVLATQNEVIPYGVGLDIGCRMSLTIYDVPANYIAGNKHKIKNALQEQTHFGIGTIQNQLDDHEVLDRNEFHEIELLRQYHGKAMRQLGTSGSGNHFVEVGAVELSESNNMGLPEGNYVGVLAHSGSRGLGAAIASYYTQVAMDTCILPKSAKHLAWLDLNTEAGMEYWIAMNLAGDYAQACHDVIHQKMSKSLGLKPFTRIENHHNFAWKEIQSNGEEFIVHRKGATPAKSGEWGIIPSSMTAPGYIVSGKGNADALNSASHGAGRRYSRRKAKECFTRSDLKKRLKQERVTLIGGGVDEAPMVYKDLEAIMPYQSELVQVEGKFYPQIVRMNKD